MSEQALADIRVIDLTRYIAGPYCTKLLADYGADVIKIEKPFDGDPARRMGPFLHDDPHPEKSGLFLHLNTNKKSITLNLKEKKGKEILSALLKEADVLVESFSPSVMPRLGFSYEELEKINPMLVVTSVSNFGQTGPYRDYKASELIIYGMGGEMYGTGLPDREPLKKGGRVIEYQGGVHAASATMVALFAAQADKKGRKVDVSLMETQLGSIDRRMSFLLDYQYNGPKQQVKRIHPMARSAVPITGVYPCKDGHFSLIGGMIGLPRVTAMMNQPELTDIYGTPEAQVDVEKKEAFDALLLSWLMDHSKKECLEAGQGAKLLCAPLNNAKDLFEDSHWKERGFWEEIDHPETGPLTYPGAPVKMMKTPWRIKRPAPQLGEHNGDVYLQLGYGKDDLVRLRQLGII